MNVKHYSRTAAFTLLEIAIVLTVIGLVIGGLTVGSDMIEAGKRHKSISLFNEYRTAIGLFHTEYNAFPGDIDNATRFWGKDNSECAGDPGATATPGTCNGNGNKEINTPVTYAESHRAWQHLELAGLINGGFTGIRNQGVDKPMGQPNVRSYFFIKYWSKRSHNWDSLPETLIASNQLYFGNSDFSPKQAWGLDTKIDDGLPGRGFFFTHAVTSNCTTGTDPRTAIYDFSSASTTCELTMEIH